MNDIIGGGFTSRINLNLREDKGWSYGARAILLDAAGQRPYYAFAPVQTDRTAESMAEIDKEIRGIRSGGARPPTADETGQGDGPEHADPAGTVGDERRGDGEPDRS